MVTHSPILIDAVASADLRLVVAEPCVHVADDGERWFFIHHSVRPPGELSEVANELGIRPSDVLLARAFLIVEGKVDVAVITEWAVRLGIDLAADRICLVPSHSHTKAERVAEFVHIAYPSASIRVLLDAGPQTENTARQLTRTHRRRVGVQLLPVNEIEKLFHRGSSKDGQGTVVVSRRLRAGGLARSRPR